MHTSAMRFAEVFFAKYKPESIVEIGSYDLCGGPMKSAAKHPCVYVGMDLVPGNGVDVVMHDPYVIPAENGVYDAAVSTSTFEHVEFFWLTFLEMVRVVRPGGLIYINAPSNGPFHQHPVDCWRFYPDAGQALAKWAEFNGYSVEVLATGIGAPETDHPDEWKDWWAVWRRK